MQKSNISWTDMTSNPIRAINLETGKEGWFCTKLSEGCSNCYSSDVNLRYGNKLEFNTANLPKITFVLKVKEFDQWFKEKSPRRIFLCSMTDLFHESIPNEFRHAIFEAMQKAPWHTYQILTKRPEDHASILYVRPGWMYAADKNTREIDRNYAPDYLWLGTSVENQKVLNRIRHFALDSFKS